VDIYGLENLKRKNIKMTIELKKTECIRCLKTDLCYPLQFNAKRDAGTHYICFECMENIWLNFAKLDYNKRKEEKENG
jgi:hypothetical protein